MRVLRLLSLLLLIVVIAACRGGSRDRLDTMPVDQMYETGHQALTRGNNDRAIRYYQRLISRFPFGPYTEQAQLDLAYVQYRAKRNDEAISTVDRFLKTYPTHPKADYAQYLRGVVNFYREASFIGRYVKLDPAARDQGATRQSFIDFSRLLREYPDSPYAEDSRLRMVFLRNQMARHEIMIAQYYLRRGAFVAAINRSKYVLENYQQAPEIGDALALMVESYKSMGEQQLADDTLRVLELNHPSHPYLRGESMTRGKAFWRKMIPFG